MTIDKIRKYEYLFKNNGFKQVDKGFLKRRLSDSLETQDSIIKFKKGNILIDIRTYLTEDVIRFKNTKYNEDYIDINAFIYFFESKEFENQNLLKKTFILITSFFGFRKEIELSQISDFYFFFIKRNLSEILLLLEDINALNQFFCKEKENMIQFINVFFSNKKKLIQF